MSDEYPIEYIDPDPGPPLPSNRRFISLEEAKRLYPQQEGQDAE